MRDRLQKLTGYKKYAAAFALGALGVLAMPPIGFFPVLLVCVPGLIFLSQTAPSRFRAFLTGWAFGAGYFIFGLYWVSAALFVDIDTWGWVLPLSLVAGPAALGLFYGFIPLLAHDKRATPLAHALLMLAAWGLVEFGRGHVLTGFPWNLYGYAWDRALPMLQPAALVGIYGLTFLTLLWAALPALWSAPRLRLAVLGSFIFCAGWGAWRIDTTPPLAMGAYTVRVVQANIPQTVKWNEREEWRNLEAHADLSSKDVNPDRPPHFVVWPETAVTADMTLFPEISRYIGMKLPKHSIGILGNLRVTLDENNQPTKFYNSVAAISTGGKVLATYDKHHLVPFGEYIPFREKFDNIRPIALALSGIGDFTRGPGPQTISIPPLPTFSPLICYEVIFPGKVAKPGNRPNWLVNVTNDAWYGRTAGPYQHLAISRLRAVEQGLPLARAANTGISAMIDPLGRVIARVPLGERGFFDSALPKHLPQPFYARTGEATFFLMIFAAMLAGFLLGRKPRSTEKDTP